MFNLVEKRRLYFGISLSLFVLGVIAMIISSVTFGAPLRLGIDFTSGSLLELRFDQVVDADTVRETVTASGFTDATVQRVGDGNQLIIRTKEMDVETKEALKASLGAVYGPSVELRYENVGPTIGRETTQAAVLAIIAASVAILFFVAIAFRKVPNAFRYGVCAITKMLHDVILLLGVASLLGLVAGWEVDALFLTALVTVVGFSVQDVIVVFDRIRENIRRRRGESFETIVNRSLLETLHRSLATQLNAIFVMIAIVFFGGVTMRQFMLVMLIGMVMGTYSSLFFAVPMLVSWEKGEIGRLFRRSSAESAA